MKEFKTIIDTYEKIDFSERKAALATVVQVKGSSYRSPGARMLMLDNGRWVGSISGGCLEGDAQRKARKVILNKEPRTVTYDTSSDDGNQLGIGLGCNGIIDILIEPIDPDCKNNPIEKIKSYIAYGNYGASATVFESDAEGVPVGSQVVFDDQKQIIGQNEELNTLLANDLNRIIEDKKSEVKTILFKGKKLTVFLEVIQPSIDLLIFGGGFDAQPVAELAHVLGWNVRVSDECVAHLIPINFPKANQVQACKKEFIKKEVKITPFTAVVLMSHNLNYDKEALYQIIDSPAPYIGILGPLKRAKKLYNSLEEDHGITLSEEHKHRIHAPIGLDIGAETPEEIAMSIIGEIQAKFNNRSGGFIKYRTGPIHHRDGKDDQVFKQVYLKHFFSKQKNN